MIKPLLSIAAFFALSFLPVRRSEENIIFRRISYVYQLKARVGNKVWPSFGSSFYNVPLIYYGKNVTYIANPSPKFIASYHQTLVFKTGGLNIYKLNFRLDSIPLHMEVQVTEGPDTTLYDYRQPFINCSSAEDIAKADSAIKTVRQWAALVVHECFHGYQFLHQPYAQYANDKGFIHSSLGDSLQNLYAARRWFKDIADLENKALLNAIKAPDKKQMNECIRRFFRLRKQRRLLTTQKTNLHIDFLEKNFETLEGTARYIEAAILYAVPETGSAETWASVDNSSRSSGKDKVDKRPPYLYSTQVSERYFYATGYNIARLLDKAGVSYKTVLFSHVDLTLEDLLAKAVQ